jgi:hypothetical protein
VKIKTQEELCKHSLIRMGPPSSNDHVISCSIHNDVIQFRVALTAYTCHVSRKNIKCVCYKANIHPNVVLATPVVE